MKKIDPKGSFWKRREAIYQTKQIAEHPDQFFNKRGLEMLKKARKELVHLPTDGRDSYQRDIETIIKLWRQHNEPKHRQLAISRDFIAARDLIHDPNTLFFLGYRDNQPACVHILSRSTFYRNTEVNQIVEKSLNYSAIPGGKAGTADANLVFTCEYLSHIGVERINAGGYDGGGWGLSPHKARFAKEEDDLNSIYFEVSYPHLDKEKYRKVTI
jgi:hypothetical protein